MNSQPGVNEMLALLDALKGAVRDFVAREEKLESDFRVQSAAAASALIAQNEAQETAAFELESNADDAMEAEKSRLQSRFEQRKARISHAHTAVSQRVTGAITECDAIWKERTQQGVAAAEIHRDEALVNATTDYNNFQQNLVAAGEELARLEAAARSKFYGYGKFRRLLAPGRAWPEPDLKPDHNALFSELQKLQEKTDGNLKRFGKFPLPVIFKFLPVWLLSVLLLGVAAANPVLAHFHRNDISRLEAGLALGGFFLVVIFYFLGGRAAAPLATAIAGDVAKMRRLFDVCIEKSAVHLGVGTGADQKRI